MFYNISAKIKKMADIQFKVGVIGGAIFFVIFLVIFLVNADYLEYATVYGGAISKDLNSTGNVAYLGMIGAIVSVIVIVSSIILSLPLYGFGELIYQVTEINRTINSVQKGDNDKTTTLMALKNKGLITEEEYQIKLNEMKDN